MTSSPVAAFGGEDTAVGSVGIVGSDGARGGAETVGDTLRGAFAIGALLPQAPATATPATIEATRAGAVKRRFDTACGSSWSRSGARPTGGDQRNGARRKAWFPKASQRALLSIDMAPVHPTSRIGALDGLRAVAVSAVLLYHFAPRSLPSGFLGVDVFMVVSGYIVTSLLMRERLRSGRIRIAAFWGRRFRRLVPALAVLVVVVTEVVRRTGPAAVADAARGQGLASMLYVANWKLIGAGVSYGGALGARSPFVHLWSLAVEEQFYLVWPLVLVGLLAISRTRQWPVVAITATAAASSAAWMAYLYEPGRDPVRIYYGTDTRAQAFLVGAVAALVLPRLGTRARHMVRVAGPVAFVAVLAAMATDTPGVLYRGGFAVVAIATAVATMATTMPGVLTRALDRGPLRGLGRVSYGVYLWHWPAVVLLTPERVGANGISLAALRLAFTGAGAAASWVVLERPLTYARPRHVAFAGGIGVSLATVALVTLPAGPVFAYSTMRTDRVPEPVVFVSSRNPAPATAPRVRRDRLALPPTGTVMLVGDSGMYSATPAFAARLDAAGWRVIEMAYPGVGLTRLPNAMHHAWATTAARYHVDLTIVMLGAWDVAWEREHGADAYRSIVERSLGAFAAGHGKVLWLSALPGGDRDDRTLDPFYAAAAKDRPGTVDYLDIESALRAPDGTWPRAVGGRILRQRDGWHLCPDGADAVARTALVHLGLEAGAVSSDGWRSNERYAPADEGCPH